MRVTVATHGHCFDGLASAVIFTRFLTRFRSPTAEFVYRACGYGGGQQVPSEAMFDGQENVVLDYRFFPSERLTWYFDHHRTAFASEGDRTYFEARTATGQFFFDPSYSSCTRYIADLARSRFDVDLSDMSELIAWADRIDSANFDSAEQAIDRSHPVLRLSAVVEQYADDSFLKKYVPQLLMRPLAEVAELPRIKKLYQPLGKRFDRFVERVKRNATTYDRTVFVDLTAEQSDTLGKFVTYAHYPNSDYSVIVARLKSSIKISVGHNPWCGRDLDTDISAICARHGGGGHPYVGGISLPVAELQRARSIAEQIVRELERAAA